MSEFMERLDIEIVSVKARIEEQKRLLKTIADSGVEAASAEMRALVIRLATLEETKRKTEQQSHGG